FAVASANGLRVLPVVLRAPAWARERPSEMASPPRGDGPYAAFLTALVGRYGPQGSFWTQRPDLPRSPQRQWQVWNEPNIDTYWSSPSPFAARYVRLLRASHRALKAADPGSEVVLAGFANFSWRALADAYRAGARRWFDVAAVHPFSGRLENVLKIVRLTREAMARAGDRRKGLIISELTWPSAKGETRNTIGFETTEAGQAMRLRNAYAALLRIRRSSRIRQVFWYTWLSPDRDSPNSFSWSGLRKLGPPGADAPVDKPALAEFRRVALRVAAGGE
ncbi:MAG: polysaccharide biosynthesis protein PslG, partial [Solirubrobacteraceae bacterium]|nr:polysaccharide biosynthesis protein PslG [Solirubrobacteraceae bacterium]